CRPQNYIHKHHDLKSIIVCSRNQRCHSDLIHFAVRKSLYLSENILPDIMSNPCGNPGTAVTKKNGAADANHRNHRCQHSHLHQKSFVLIHDSLVDHIGNDRRNPQFHQSKSKDGNHVQDKPEFVSFQILRSEERRVGKEWRSSWSSSWSRTNTAE